MTERRSQHEQLIFISLMSQTSAYGSPSHTLSEFVVTSVSTIYNYNNTSNSLLVVYNSLIIHLDHLNDHKLAVVDQDIGGQPNELIRSELSMPPL
jgi:hypothetical protein